MERLSIELELRKLGLKEKEVRVYLAGLELGPSSVKNIAEVAKITRPTAYEIIKNLEGKGLFTEIKKGKKRYFIAQSPEGILGILRIQKKELEEKEREFIRIIAALGSKFSLGEKGLTRTYKGEKGQKMLEETLSFTSSSEILIISSETNLKDIKKREAIYQKIKKRLGKIEVKEIYPEELKLKSKLPHIQRKVLSLPTLGGTLILFDKAIFFPTTKLEGFLIKNQLIANLLKSFFSALWRLI